MSLSLQHLRGPDREVDSYAWITVIFFASGFSALLYQVVWQRVLYAAFGVNVEAVTVVVTAFLAGLGAGSLVGGRLAQGTERSLLRAFGTVELCIGSFGLISLPFFRMIGELTLGLPSVPRGLVTAMIVMAPTSLMGATLPLLAACIVRSTGNVGQSVGLLYFVNTAGSAAAALASVLFILGRFGEQKSVALAASINLVVAAFVLAIPARRTGAR